MTATSVGKATRGQGVPMASDMATVIGPVMGIRVMDTAPRVKGHEDMARQTMHTTTACQVTVITMATAKEATAKDMHIIMDMPVDITAPNRTEVPATTGDPTLGTRADGMATVVGERTVVRAPNVAGNKRIEVPTNVAMADPIRVRAAIAKVGPIRVCTVAENVGQMHARTVAARMGRIRVHTLVAKMDMATAESPSFTSVTMAGSMGEARTVEETTGTDRVRPG